MLIYRQKTSTLPDPQKIAQQILDLYNYINNYIVMNKNYLRTLPAQWRSVSKAFTALGDEHRQRILLTFEPGERLNVSQIVAVSSLSRSAVDHHLRVLREAEVLLSEKVGKEVYLWINKPLLLQVMKDVRDYVKNKT